MTETDALIARVLAIDVTATKGPWRFEINRKHREVKICGGRPQFDATVIDFVRWGTSGAAPRFRDTDIMYRAEEFAEPVPGREHHADWFAALNHPDARAIEDFRTDAPKLARMLREALAHICHMATLRDDYTEEARVEALAAIEKIAMEGA